MVDTSSVHTGRPLDRGRDQAILDAALACLAELGYDRLTMDEVAARAHASKATIYRRWPSKARLVVQAVLAWRETIAPTVIPDSGSLSGDLEAMVEATPDFGEAGRRQLGVIVGLAGAAGRDPDLMPALSTLFEHPRSLLRDILSRGVARGEVSGDCDLDLIVDGVLGLTLFRALLGNPPDPGFVRRLVRNLIDPLVATPPAAYGSVPATRPPGTDC